MIILTVKGAGSFNAGPKAPSDIIEILTKKYNAESVLLVQGNGIIEKIKYRKKIFSTILKAKRKKKFLFFNSLCMKLRKYLIDYF